MTENTYTAADFEGHRIAHNGDDIALRRDIYDAPWSRWIPEDGRYIAGGWASHHTLASEGWTPGPPPRNEGERDDEIEDLRKAVWERGEIIGDLREDLASAEARVPSTSEEALTLAWELACPVPEEQMIPAGTPLIERGSDGEMMCMPEGDVCQLAAQTVQGLERRTLRPLPAPRPRHAEVIGGVLIAEIGMHDDDARDTADKIARAIEEQETDDE